MHLASVLLAMVVYLVALLAIIHYFRHHYRASMWFWAASLLTFPLWIVSGGVDGWFRWFKILSVLVPITIVGLSRIAVQEERTGRIWELLASKKFLWFFYGILFLNILEATLKDVQLHNYWNALAGMFLCFTIPFAPRFWHFTGDANTELIAYTTAGWNFLYTTWNLCFTYGEAGPHFAGSLCILLAAELYPILARRPELYITARMYTLATHLLIRACWDLFPAYMSSDGWFNENIWQYWGFANFALSVPFMFWFLWQLDTGRSVVMFRRGSARQQFLQEHPEWLPARERVRH